MGTAYFADFTNFFHLTSFRIQTNWIIIIGMITKYAWKNTVYDGNVEIIDISENDNLSVSICLMS
jgi:hypothetical protein